MKRGVTDSPMEEAGDKKMKKLKQKEDVELEEEGITETGFKHLDENLVFEVLKHVDAKTLAMASCVSKIWNRTAHDERIWELICTKHWANIGCGDVQLRSVVLALGGFRRLHSLYIWPLSKPQSSTSGSSSWSPFPAMIGNKPATRWGKDEVHLSLSLLSIKYYEKMNLGGKGR